jgi:hypothetical protein
LFIERTFVTLNLYFVTLNLYFVTLNEVKGLGPLLRRFFASLRMKWGFGNMWLSHLSLPWREGVRGRGIKEASPSPNLSRQGREKPESSLPWRERVRERGIKEASPSPSSSPIKGEGKR